MVVGLLNRVVKESVLGQVRRERSLKGVSDICHWRKSIPDKGSGLRKGPEAWACWLVGEGL